jgi:hypothetical protein
VQQKRAAVALGFALGFGVTLGTAHYLVEGGSLLRTSTIFITAGLFMTPVYYFSAPDRRVTKLIAGGAGMLPSSPRTRPPALSATPAQRQSPGADATGRDDAGPERTD